MEKRERLEKTIAGEPTDRAPIALWRRFPGDDLRAADLAHAVIEFQRAHDWDFAVLMPASTATILDYGVNEQWHGSPDGLHTVIKPPVERSLHWTELRSLDPSRGSLARVGDAARLVTEALPDVPLVLALPSPLDQADMLAGRAALIRHMRTQPDRLKSGLNILTENMLRFTESLRRLPLAGVCFMSSFASYAFLAEEEYRIFGQPYDRAILGALPQRYWLNILHLTSELPMFRLASALPAQIVHWRDRDTEPDLAQGKSQVIGAVGGGLSAAQDLYLGTPTVVRDAVRGALERANQRRLIVSTGVPLMLNTPLSHIRAARAAVEPAGG